MATTGLRNSLVVPQWLANRPALQNGYMFVWSVAMLCDVMMEGIIEGQIAAFPGLGTTTALPLIGRNRGLIQGSAQSNASYETILREALQLWTNAAGDETLLTILQAFIPGNTTLRIVNRAQRWVSFTGASEEYDTGIAAPAGAVTPFTYTSTAVLNWDGNSNPGNSGNWSDIWIICSGQSYPAETRTLTQIAGAYATLSVWAATGFGVGQQVPRVDANAIKSLVQLWKGEHANVKAIIFDYANQFNPDVGPTANGYCESWSYPLGGVPNTPQRPSAARYWQLSYCLPI